MLSCFRRVRIFSTLWTTAHQAPLSMGFSRQEYWAATSSSRDLPDPGIEPTSLMSPALTGGFFTTIATWEAQGCHMLQLKKLAWLQTRKEKASPDAQIYTNCQTHHRNQPTTQITLQYQTENGADQTAGVPWPRPPASRCSVTTSTAKPTGRQGHRSPDELAGGEEKK